MNFKIPAVSEAAREEAHRRWSSCAHPLGGLGSLESVIEDIAALTGSADVELKPRSAIILCSDNGVVDQGVAQAKAEVTGIVANSLAKGVTSVCKMADVADCRVIPVDMGIKDFPGAPGILDRRIGNGTEDISVGPAMTREAAENGIQAGIDLVGEEKARGTRIIAAGEMGIGNTTTASAVTSVLLSLPPEQVTGRGAGLSKRGLTKKIEIVKRAVSVNRPDPRDPIDVIRKVGGFDIAGLCGLFIGGAVHRVPIIIDGAITAAAALCACILEPRSRDAMIASHVSSEPSGRLLLKAIGKEPIITAGMHLGEGTGAVALLPLLDMVLAVYSDSYTFAEGRIRPYEPLGD